MFRAFAVIPERDRALAATVQSHLMPLFPMIDTFVKRVPAELPKGPAAWIPAAVLSELRMNLAIVIGDVSAAEARVENQNREAAAAAAAEQPAPE